MNHSNSSLDRRVIFSKLVLQTKLFSLHPSLKDLFYHSSLSILLYLGLQESFFSFFLNLSDLLLMAHQEIISHHSSGNIAASNAIVHITMESDGESRPARIHLLYRDVRKF
jgi:hypothetical protein